MYQESQLWSNGQLTITVRSGRLSISDIGHPKDFMFDLWNIPARNGLWHATPDIENFGDYGYRLRSVFLNHAEAELCEPGQMFEIGTVNIDYGTCVICDSNIYHTQELESRTMLWKKEKERLLMSSGFGAGSYKVFRNDGIQATCIAITFITPEMQEQVGQIVAGTGATAEELRRIKAELILQRHVTFMIMGLMISEEERKRALQGKPHGEGKGKPHGKGRKK